MRQIRQMGLRTRIALFFVLIGTVAVLMLVGAGIWIGTRVEDPALSTALSGIAMAGFAICGLVAWVATRIDETLARPLEIVFTDIRSFAESGGTKPPLAHGDQALGMIDHDARATAEALERAMAALAARKAKAGADPA